MSSDQDQPSSMPASMSPFGIFAPAMDYLTDAAQRGVLFWDVMRQRGNQYHQHLAERAPHVLDYQVELLVDGRTLDRPVNYALVRVIPPAGVEIDQIFPATRQLATGRDLDHGCGGEAVGRAAASGEHLQRHAGGELQRAADEIGSRRRRE